MARRSSSPPVIPASATTRAHLRPHLITPIACVALLPVTGLAHLNWGHQPVALVFITLLCVGLCWLAWAAAKARGALVRAEAEILAAAGSAWTIAAVIAGPITRPVIDFWFLLWVGGSLMVSIVHGLRRGPSESAGDNTSTLKDRVSALKDATIRTPTVRGKKVTTKVVMPEGESFDAVTTPQARASLASALDVAPTAIRTIPDPDSARRGTLEVVPVDQLRSSLEWPGPSAPGGSIMEPVVLGVREDGEPLQMWFPGDPSQDRNASHLLITGMSGAGKTVALLSLAVEVVTRVDAELELCDGRKGDQLPKALKAAATRTAFGTEAVLRRLAQLQADVSTRAKVLGDQGMSQWQPGAKWPSGAPMKYRVVVIEEAAGEIGLSEELVGLSETCRSVGIALVIMVQRAHHTRLSTSVRANIGAALAFGVKEQGDADLALSEETLDQGAAPWKWKNNKPGYCYAEVPGVPPECWADACRTWAPAPEAMEEWLNAAVGGWVVDAEETAVVDEPDAVAELDDGEGKGEAEDEDEPLLPPPGHPDRLPMSEPPDPGAKPDRPIAVPDGPGRRIGPPADRAVPPARARELLREALAAHAATGAEELRPADLADVLEVTGRSASWLSGELQRMASGPEAVLVNPSKGYYLHREGALQPA